MSANPRLYLPCRLKKVLGSKSSGSRPSASSHTSFSWSWLPYTSESIKWHDSKNLLVLMKMLWVVVPFRFVRAISSRPTALSTHYRVVDFGVISVLLPHLFIVLLLLPSLLLIQHLQMLPSLMFLHHFIPFELFVTVLVKILKIICCLWVFFVERHKKNQ